MKRRESNVFLPVSNIDVSMGETPAWSCVNAVENSRDLPFALLLLLNERDDVANCEAERRVLFLTPMAPMEDDLLSINLEKDDMTIVMIRSF